MTYARYVRTCLADDPRFFYPLRWGNPHISYDVYGSPLLTDDAALTAQVRRPMQGADPMPDFAAATAKRSASTSTNFYNASFTLECWVRIAGLDAQNVAVCCATSGNPLGHMFDMGTTFFRFFVGDTAGNDFLNASINPTTYPGGVLHRPLHLVGATDGARADFWINGKPVAEDTTTAGTRFTTAAQTLYVSRYNSSFTSYMRGGVSLVAGYHKYDVTLAARHYAAAQAGVRRKLARAA